MAFDFPSNPNLYFAVVGVMLALFLISRVPVLRTLLNVAVTFALVAVFILVLGQRERFDPWFGRAATRLGVESQQVAGKEMRIRMSPDGHFWVRATIDGYERRLLVDSGATVTALSARTAAAAGLQPHDEAFPIILETANGRIRPQTAQVASLSIGNIVARDLAVVVSPAFGDMDVLGMNFLSRLKSWRVEGQTLILTPHHPQGVAG